MKRNYTARRHRRQSGNASPNRRLGSQSKSHSGSEELHPRKQPFPSGRAFTSHLLFKGGAGVTQSGGEAIPVVAKGEGGGGGAVVDGTTAPYVAIASRPIQRTEGTEKVGFLEKYSSKLGFRFSRQESSNARSSSSRGADVEIEGWAGMTDRKPSGHARSASASSIGSSIASMMPWNYSHNGPPGTSSSGGGSSNSMNRSASPPRAASGKSFSTGTVLSTAHEVDMANSPTSEEEKPEAFEEAPMFSHPLYTLVESNRLEQNESVLAVTSADMNSVLDSVGGYVSACMKHYYNVTEVYIPSRRAKAINTILVSHNWQTANKLVILVTNQPGGHVGIWSRSLCFEQGLRYGTMLPYVDMAYRNDYAVIICNANCNTQTAEDETGATVQLPIEGSSTPEEHVTWVYDHLITQAQAEHVFLVGYSNGARLCKEMVARSLTFQHHTWEAKPITGVALIESCRLKDKEDAHDVTQFLSSHTVNFKRSQVSAGKNLYGVASSIGIGSCISLGNKGTNNPAWSVYYGMNEVFKFCQKHIDKKITRIRMPSFRGLIKSKRVGSSSKDGSIEDRASSKASSSRASSEAGGADSITGDADDGSFFEIRRKDSWDALLDRQECMTVDNFVLERVIGKGAFGKVLMARIKGDMQRKVYAMKVINKSEIIRRGYVESTKLEKSILGEADHPFIVHLRYAFQNHVKLYLVTDFYNGGNLLVHLKRNYTFAEHVARFFAAEVFLAIEYLHDRNIVYRDLKPENVLMESSGHIALTDFGLSKQLLEDERTSTFCGTAEYLAPEQLRRSQYGKAVDWWAFGIFTYEMLNGRSPFYNRSRTSMYERIVNEEPAFSNEMSPDAVDFISLLLKKNPEKRLGATTSVAIKNHPFFREIDWMQLLAKDATPPINPDIARASDCRYISSRYLTLEPRDTLEGEGAQRFSNFTFIGDDSYHQAVASCGLSIVTSSDGRDSSSVTSGSDVTPPYISSAYTTSSGFTSSTKGHSGADDYIYEKRSGTPTVVSQTTSIGVPGDRSTNCTS